jgi:hypothetical protein
MLAGWSEQALLLVRIQWLTREKGGTASGIKTCHKFYLIFCKNSALLKIV